MKKAIIIFIILFSIVENAVSQKDSLITVEGTLTNFIGKPLKVKIYTYNRRTREYKSLETDQKGYYKVKVRPGTIITYLNNVIYKVLVDKPVTAYTKAPEASLKTLPPANKIKGHAEMGDLKYNPAVYFSKIYGLPVNAALISYYDRYIKNIYFNKLDNTFYVETYNNYNKYRKYFIDYSSSFSVDFPNKLAQVQRQYSQGSNGLKDKETPFSYGEMIDENTTKTYNSYHFFQPAYNFLNSLKLGYNLKNMKIMLNYKNDNVRGIIPNSKKQVNNVSFYIDDLSIKNLEIDIKGFYNDTRINFSESNSNYSRLMHSITSTSPTFDNENAEQTAYFKLAKNPYKEIADSYNFDKFQQFGSSLKLNYKPDGYEDLYYVVSFYKNKNLFKDGYTDFIQQPWYIERKTNQNHFFTSLNYLKTFAWYPFVYTIYLNSQFEHLNYINQFDKSSTLIPDFPNNKRNFNEHFILNKFSYRHWNPSIDISLDINGSLYNSNTLTDKKIYILPTGLFSVCIENILTLETEYSKTIKEYPINIPNLYFNTLLYSSESFAYFKDIHYPKTPKNIQPENIDKLRFLTTLEFREYRRYFELYAIYDIIKHQNTIIPILDNNFTLKNAVDYTENNFKINFKYTDTYNYSLDIAFDKPTSKVTKILSSANRIPYAGFSDVSLNFIENYPVGAIVGSSFKRDENNNVIIGANGFPLVNDSPAIIGDPTPDWILNLKQEIKINRFELSVYLEYKKGGEVWNGTKNALDYYGISKKSADLRNQGELIIAGVTQNGDVNTKAVSAQSYLQYYGKSGIAENAIEDASWFKINSVTLSYINRRESSQERIDFTVSIWAKNLLIYTPYSGVDPQTALFGYQTNQALDYYNLPALKSFGFTFNLKF